MRIGACRAIAAIASVHDEGAEIALRGYVREILEALSRLLHETNEDTVHIGLESLQMVIRAADPATCEVAIVPLTTQLLAVWRHTLRTIWWPRN